MDVTVSIGTVNRLRRIMALRGWSEERALDYAINLAWLMEEKRAAKVKKALGNG